MQTALGVAKGGEEGGGGAMSLPGGGRRSGLHLCHRHRVPDGVINGAAVGESLQPFERLLLHCIKEQSSE